MIVAPAALQPTGGFESYFVNFAPRQVSGGAVAILGHRAAGKNARRAIPSLGGAEVTK